MVRIHQGASESAANGTAHEGEWAKVFAAIEASHQAIHALL